MMSERDFSIVTGPIRPNAVPVHIYNDGLTVFLFDESFTDHIREENPEVIWSIGEDTFEEPKTKALLSKGEMLVYGLRGDGSVNLEVVVGLPLTESELSGGKWYPTETGFIKLPTGKLCVHSFNTLPMGDNDENPEDEGACLEVPPGDYIVRLYRKDWDTMENEGIMDLGWAEEAGIEVYENGRIDEVIVLTAVDDQRDTQFENVLCKKCLTFG